MVLMGATYTSLGVCDCVLCLPDTLVASVFSGETFLSLYILNAFHDVVSIA